MREWLEGRTYSRWLGLAALVGLVLLVARELGFVDFSLSTRTTRGERHSNFGTSNESKERSLAIEYVDGERRATRHVLRSDAEPLAVRVEVTHFDLDGWTWTPLWKRVSCTFAARITSDDGGITGQVNGTIDLRVLGLHSARALREELHAIVEGYCFEPFKP